MIDLALSDVIVVGARSRLVRAIIAAGAMTRVDASTAVTNFMEVSSFWRLLLEILFLPLAPHRHGVGKRVALSLVMPGGCELIESAVNKVMERNFFVATATVVVFERRLSLPFVLKKGAGMKKRRFTTAAIAVFTVFVAMAHTVNASEPDLSAAETTVVNRQIVTLKAPGDRRMASGWSNAKKVAELICRPAALPVLKKQTPGVDRVFLGTDDPTDAARSGQQPPDR